MGRGVTRGMSDVVNPWFWILVAPLAWSLAHCLRALAHEPDWRPVPMAAVLVALAGAQWGVVPPGTGFDLAQLTLDGQLAPLAGWFGLNVLAGVAVWAGVRSFVERNQAETRRWHDLAALQGLSRYANAKSQELETALFEVLSLGCAQLECEIGIVTHVGADHWEIRALYGPLEFEPGDRLPLEATPCAQTLAAGAPTTLSRAEVATPQGALSFARYIGVPLFIAGRCEGTVCFARRQAGGPPFSAAQIHSAALVAEVVMARLANAPPEPTATHEPATEPVAAVSVENPRPLPGCLRVDAWIRDREVRLREILGEPNLLQLQLDDDDAEVEIGTGDLESIVLALVFHAAQMGEASEPGARFTLETSRIEAEPGPYNAASFVTVSVHAPALEPEAQAFARRFEPGAPATPGFAGLSETRDLLQQQGGDLSGQIATGIGITLTAFLPIKEEKDDARSLLLPQLS